MSSIRQHAKLAAIIISVLCVITGLIFAGLGFASMQARQRQSQANHTTMIRLEQDIKHLKAQQQRLDSERDRYKNSAASAGFNVAKLQTQYIQTDFIQQSQDVQTVGKSLAQYAADMTVVKPWYFVTPSYSANVTWTFKSTYSYAGKTTKVIWTCNNGTHVVAYATGTYDSNSQKFSHITVYWTDSGVQGRNSSEDAQYKQQANRTLAAVKVKQS